MKKFAITTSIQETEKPILIVGLGVTGKSVFEYYKALGKEICIADDSIEKVQKYIQEQKTSFSYRAITIKELITQFHPDMFSVRIVSPGLSPKHPIFMWMSSAHFTSELELALCKLYDFFSKKGIKKPHIVGVTGTNGKTTTVELIEHLCNQVGLHATAYGNIGRPLIELLTKIEKEGMENVLFDDVYVIELSSYQIERLHQSIFTSCVWLNIAPDHLEWHGSFDAYKAAKEKLLSLIVPSKYAQVVLHDSLGKVSIPDYVRSIRYKFIKKSDMICDGSVQLYAKEEIIFKNNKEIGQIPLELQSEYASVHDIENYLAAAQIVHDFGFSYDVIQQGYASFRKGPHRIQHVGSICEDGLDICFFDDSKGTNIHATLAAVEAVPQPIVLIAGGVHKGHPYTEWREKFPGVVEHIMALGAAKEEILKDLKESMIPITLVDSLQEGVIHATIKAKMLSKKYGKKVSVLLSPGCSSFDMFQDYKDRGMQFQKLVEDMLVTKR